MDTLTNEARRMLMSRVRGKDTAPELHVRKALHSAGYRFRLHRRDLPSKPDIVLPRYRTAIFIHGCFWHGHDCKRGELPKTNSEFWHKKIGLNRVRDEKALLDLTAMGWRVVVIWQCGLNDGLTQLLTDLDHARGASFSFSSRDGNSELTT